MESGKFISFEGGEGCGKSTQVGLLSQFLEQRGLRCVVTREPGGTKGAEAIRSLLLEPPDANWTARAEALLFAAARVEHAAKVIRPAIEHGDWVLCDRFVDSSRAYQGGAGGLNDNAILDLHNFGSAGLMPDMTILIEISTAEAKTRLARRDVHGSDAIGGRDIAYHEGVARRFDELASQNQERIRRLNGEGSIDAVQQRVRAAVLQHFGGEI